MNLLEALEKKKALKSVLEDLISTLGLCANDLEELSETLTCVDEIVDELFRFERLITKHYQETLITAEDSISDALTHISALSKKIDILKYLLLETNKEELLAGKKAQLNQKAVLSSIKNYESMKNDLVSRVKNTCYNTPFIDSVP